MPTTKSTTKLEGKPPWADRHRRIGHYGGALDKENCESEKIPYAWGWYRELQAMRGSAYSYEPSGLVHVEHLALARSEAARTRAAERLGWNGNPLTSDDRLEEWASVFKVPVYQDDTRQDLRQRVAAHYQIARAATRTNLEESCSKLLGENFVKLWRVDGADLATPPPQTYWPVINTGTVNYSLTTPQSVGGVSQAWFSERAHLTIEVQTLANQTQTQFLEMMNVHLYDLLDRMLPSQCTFNWALGITGGGFILDQSSLDFTGFGYE